MHLLENRYLRLYRMSSLFTGRRRKMIKTVRRKRVKLIPPSNHLVFTEDQEATALASYLRALESEGAVELYSHIPHETYTPYYNVRRKNLRQGVKKGVPDYIIVTKTEIIFIELKRRRYSPSDVSAEQKEWLARLNGKQAVTTICGGFLEAKAFLKTRGIETKSEYY